MTNQKSFGAGFNNLADTSHFSTLKLTNRKTNLKNTIDNVPGKQASAKILYSIATNNYFTISHDEAETGLLLFGDYIEEENLHPNSHPNIRFLMDVIANNEEWTVEIE